MNYSIVTLTANPDNILTSGRSFLKHEPNLPAERLIIVDDGSRQQAESSLPGVTWLEGAKPFIFARNANIGLRHAFEVQQADVAVLVNDDAILRTHQGFTKLAARHFEHRNHVGIMSAVTNFVGNPRQQITDERFAADAVLHEQKMLCFVCVSITHRAWSIIGELDERFTGYGFDDDDYSHRCRLNGLRLAIYPACFVDHATLHSTYRGDAYPMEEMEHNRKLFVRKYKLTGVI